MKKTKIAIVTYTLNFGGLERVVSNQSMLLDGLGFEVTLFVLENKIGYPFAGDIHVYNFQSKEKLLKKIYNYKKLKENIHKGQFDFIFDHRYRLNTFMESIWLKYVYRNQNLVYFIHNGEIEKYINSRIIKNPKIQFIAVSKGIEDKIKSLYHINNIQTIYNSVEVTTEEIEFEEKNDKYILAIGRMSKPNVKQFDVLIDCYSQSILPLNNIKLIILGDGELNQVFKEQVLRLNLEEYVTFKGFQSKPYSYYKSAKFLVLSSKFEGLPTVLIESLLSGTPVVAYDCEFGPSEIIQHKINGLLVENQNKSELIKAMNLLIQDENLYKKLCINSKKSAQKFTPKSIEQKWISFFNDK